jgi:hypothetical protein
MKDEKIRVQGSKISKHLYIVSNYPTEMHTISFGNINKEKIIETIYYLYHLHVTV